jgi:2-methylcitrate dehydratase
VGSQLYRNLGFSTDQEASTDKAAANPRIDALRAKIRCVEDKRFSAEYHDPEKRSIGNALLVELNDGTKLDEVEVEYPVGHKRRVSHFHCVLIPLVFG